MSSDILDTKSRDGDLGKLWIIIFTYPAKKLLNVYKLVIDGEMSIML